MLVDAGKFGPELYDDHVIRACLNALTTASQSGKLPPVNLQAILSPLLKAEYGKFSGRIYDE